MRRARQELDLMLAELAQLLRRKLLLFEKPEYCCSAIVTRKVVRRTRPSRGSRIVHDPARRRRLAQRRELTEPARHHGSEVRVLGKTQERIAGPKLAVLVTAAYDVGPLQPLLSQ